MAAEPLNSKASEQRLDDVVVAYLKSLEAGFTPDPEEWLRRHPELAAELREFFADQAEVRRWTAPLRPLAPATPPPEGTDTPLPAVPETADRAPAAPLPTLGDYELLAVIGRGGMGVVFEARQKSLNRTVALKMIRVDPTASPAEGRRFRNEAEMAASLDHPNIVPVYEVAEHAGQLYFSMKRIEGGSLADKLDGFAADPKSAARLLATVARAVHHAHQRGILHRDLKPANILLDKEGQPHVTDFGLARRVEVDSSLTQSGALVGTPSYMAPEQTAGKKEAITTATDVYGLGAVLYALLAGRPPFRAETVLATLEQVKGREPEPPSRGNRQLDRDLETVCLKCLYKEPEKRYASALALAEDLDRWLNGEPIQARRAGPWERLRKWGKRQPALAALIGVAAAAGVSLVCGIVWHNGQLQAAAELARREQKAAEEERRRAQKSATAERRAAAEAQAERRHAEDNLRRAVEAWGQSFEFFLERPHSKDTPELAMARKAQTEKASQFFLGLRAQVDKDPARRHEAALVHGQLGRVYIAMGKEASAVEAFSRSVVLYRQVIAVGPTELRYQAALQDLYRTIIGAAFAVYEDATKGSHDPGRGQEILERYGHAARLYGLIPVNWFPPDNQSAVNRIFSEPVTTLNLAKRLYAGGRPAEAETALDRSIALAEKAPARYPGQVYRQFLWLLEAQGRSLRGLIRWEAGRDAEDDYRRAAGLFAKLTPTEIASLGAYPDLACLEESRGELLWARGHWRGAADAFSRAEAAWRKVTMPANLRRHRELAWFLATCPDKRFRKPEEAATLSERAVAKPNATDALAWRTRGVALFRAGRPKAAAEALEKGMGLSGGGDAVDWFFLAMAYWQLGKKANAREWYGKAASWAERHRPKDPRLLRFRAETAALLGIKDQRPKDREVAPEKK
jgi:tetratricopeptide (TPR) repeat protein